MRTVKWTAKGINRWRVKLLSDYHTHGKLTTIQVSVENITTGFCLVHSEKYESGVLFDVLKQARLLKHIIKSDSNYVSTHGPRRPRSLNLRHRLPKVFWRRNNEKRK